MLKLSEIPNLTNNTLLNRAYFFRGITEPEELNTSIKKLLPINTLSQVDRLAERLLEHIINKKRIVIIADYDCDGATSCAVMARMLMSLGANVGWLVPDRSIHGYGLSPKIVEEAYQGIITGDAIGLKKQEDFIKKNAFALTGYDLSLFKKLLNEDANLVIKTSLANSNVFSDTQKPDVLLTVDNGTASLEGVKLAHQLGMEVLITDHHLAAHELPDAIIVNPNHPQCEFTSKSLCGVGVAWYVCVKLAQLAKEAGLEPMSITELLPLVALGTIADVVALDQNNRILVETGLNFFRNKQSFVGLEALLQVSSIEKYYFNSVDIGFKVAPRINAAGRIKNMGIGIMNLITDDAEVAQITASQLNYLNETRKNITKSVTENSEHIINECNNRDYSKDYVIVVYPDENGIEWHEGVIGIAAGRLKEKWNKPSIVMTYIESDHTYKGSCRSIPQLHFKDLLDEVALRDPNIFAKYGGHAMAAGLSVHADKINDFIEIINEIAKTKLSKTDFIKYNITDGEVTLNELSVDKVLEVQKAVWGQGFPYPQFHGKYQVLKERRMGSESQHVKLTLKQGNYIMEAVRFNCQDWVVGKEVSIIFQPVINIWNEQLKVNLLIQESDFNEDELVTRLDLLEMNTDREKSLIQKKSENNNIVFDENNVISEINSNKDNDWGKKCKKEDKTENKEAVKCYYHFNNDTLNNNTIPDF